MPNQRKRKFACIGKEKFAGIWSGKHFVIHKGPQKTPSNRTTETKGNSMHIMDI